ncbi:MAG: AI-2E family transporter [Candidatus Gracilibacteria bacterium]
MKIHSRIAGVGAFIGKVAGRIQKMRSHVAELKQKREKQHIKEVVAELPRSEEDKPQFPARLQVDITVTSVIKAAVAMILVLLFFYFLYLIGDILAIFLVSALLAAALNPVVDRLEKNKVPRGIGVVLSYIVLLIVVTIVVLAVVPMLASQGEKLIQTLIRFFQNIANEGVSSIPIPFLPSSTEGWLIDRINEFRSNINVDLIFNQMQDWLLQNQGAIKDNLQQVATNFLGVVNGVFNGLTNVVLVMFFTYFLVADKENIKKYCLALFPSSYRDYLGIKLHDIQFKVGAWVRGQLLLGFTIGLSTYVGLWILFIFGIDIPYKETLAIIAGLTELIPVIGPIIAAIFGILVAANVGTVPTIAVLILFTLIQQLENNILVPVIMNHAVGLNPIVIIIGMTVGAKFFGLFGLILAIPLITVMSLFVDDIIARNSMRIDRKS